jgi:hypothetical protein
MRRLLAVVPTAVMAAITTACDGKSPTSPASPSSATPPSHTLRRYHRGALHEASGGLGEADSVVPDGVTVFDDVPAVTKLNSAPVSKDGR